MGRKKKNLAEIVQQNQNLPVLNKDGLLESEPVTTEDLTKKKEKRVITRHEMEQAVLSGKYASSIQFVEDKKGRKKKIIRFNPTPEQGLDEEIVGYQISQGLVNNKPQGSTKKISAILFSNVFTVFNIMMVGIALWLIISAVKTNEPMMNVIKQLFFIVIITINTIVSIIQEIRSKRIIDKLSNMNAPVATVTRAGITYDVSVDNVVLDDILLLEPGKQIPSDCIVVSGDIEVNESLLTGESDAIEKHPGSLLHSGSFVVSGTCKAKVERVGKDNYIQKLTVQAQKYRKPRSELMISLKRLITVMAIIIIPLGTFVFLRMWEGGNMGGTSPYMYSVSHTAGAVIGMIPSGLFLCTSIALAVGVIRLSQHHTLVQELYCIEMLARVDVLCLDKTGTITDGTMNVSDVIEFKTSSNSPSSKMMIPAILNALGDRNQTSIALENHFGLSRRYKFESTIPFSSKRKFSAVSFEKYQTYLLGAPEMILKKNFEVIQTEVERAASDGFRVLLLATTKDKIIDGDISLDNVEPVSLILIEDNIRKDAIDTIDYFKRSGVEVKVISGDNPLTVAKISQRAGIKNARKCISLDGLTDKEVIRAASKYTVFGRVSPNQKKLLVMTLKMMGHTVAMTGDGVNDILALREADCSISVASGSEAARNVSHLVLLDNNFNSMPKVVSEGRRVINNIQKVASLFLTKTIFSLFLALYALIMRDYPIMTNQLFIIEFFVIAIPSFFLALEQNNDRFKGRFMYNVIKTALPGALAVAVSTMVLFAVVHVLGITTVENQTIIVLNATVICYIVLYFACIPFNVMRRVLFIAMSIIGASIVVLIPSLMNLVPIFPIPFVVQGGEIMSKVGILTLMVAVLAAYPLILTIKKVPMWIMDSAHYFKEAVGNKKDA